MPTHVGGSSPGGAAPSAQLEVHVQQLNSDFEFNISGITNVRSISVAIRPRSGSFQLITATGTETINQAYLTERGLGEVFSMTWSAESPGDSIVAPFHIPRPTGDATGLITWTRAK